MDEKEEEELIKNIPISTTLWKPNSVKEEPQTVISQWRVYRVMANFNDMGDTIHLVGYTFSGEGRVSSPVLSYDFDTKTCMTQGGRVYKLHGPSGFNRDAMFVFNRWLTINNDPQYVDKTEEYENGNLD